MSNLPGFLDAWMKPRALANQSRIPLRKSPFGSINLTGLPGDLGGSILSRWHPQFRAAVEKGVRELVIVLVEKFGWITYSSCEGHAHAGPGLPCASREVGILPRSTAEAAKICRLLNAARSRAELRIGPSPVRIKLRVVKLESEERQYTAVDLRFERQPFASWEAYFGRLNAAYDALLKELV